MNKWSGGFVKFASSYLARMLIFVTLAVVLASTIGAVQSAPAGEVKLRQLTSDGLSSLPSSPGEAGCSPVGDRVAYYRKVTELTSELCVLEIGSEKRYSVSDVGNPCRAAWSRDGTKLAFIFSNSQAVSSDTSLMIWEAVSRKITRTALRGQLKDFLLEGSVTRPYWSPDGKRLLVSMAEGLYIVPADGSSTIKVSPNTSNLLAEFHAFSNWSADGSRIVFVTLDAAGLGQVMTADARGQNLRALTKKMPNMWGVSWSWDARQIAFTTGEGRLKEEIEAWQADVWLVNPDGSNPRPLTHGSSPVLEERTYWRIYHWTRDNRYVIGWFARQDESGAERYRGFGLVDAATGEVVPAYSYEVDTSDAFYAFTAWNGSWDGKRVAFIGTQYTVRGPRGGEQSYEDERSLLRIFSPEDRKMMDLVTYRPGQDRKGLTGAPSWTADCRSLVVTVRRIVSATEGKYEYDLYLVSVPWAEEAVRPTAPVEPTAAAQPSEPAPAQPAGPVEAAGIVELHVKHRRAAEAAELLPAAHEGTFTVDEGRNCLLVPAKAPNLQDLQLCLEAIDNSVPLIMVNVLVTELSKDANRQLGLDWEFARHRFGGVLPLGEDTTPGSVFWQGVGRLDDEFLGTLSALAQQGEAAVRANPRVLATSGKEASITIRRTDFFLYTSGTDYYGRPVRSRSDISADTILKITPILLADGRISVKVDATVDSFTFVGRDDLPDTTRRQAVTEVICSDGDSIVIGGLTQQEQSKTVHKTPLLGDLPVLGQLFRHTQRQSRESTLVIFITPHLSVPADRETTGSAELSLSP